jgi:hypothetical protein
MTQPHDVAVDSPSEKYYVGKWRGLVSTTNWQKGQIIAEWRNDLTKSGGAAAEYSDETWSQLVGDVTAQHVGRLRRVHERFGDNWQSYEGLYWTHFLAAYDWEDAELWLEGALQNAWSVSQMRKQRWETLGSIPADQPLESDIVTDESSDDPFVDEGIPSELFIEHVEAVAPGADAAEKSKVRSQRSGQPDEPESAAAQLATGPATSLEPRGSFEELPEDFAEAFEQLKLSIIRHKQSDWQELSRDDALASLESLRMIVLNAG